MVIETFRRRKRPTFIEEKIISGIFKLEQKKAQKCTPFAFINVEIQKKTKMTLIAGVILRKCYWTDIEVNTE